MGRIINSIEDCADCLCRVCARNSVNLTFNTLIKDDMRCTCDCDFGDQLIETSEQCPDYIRDVDD